MKLIRISALWCSSCILTLPLWEEIKKEYPTFLFEELDYDMDDEQVEKYQIGKIIPVIIILNEENVEIGRIVGEKKKTEILEYIEQLRSII